MARTRAHSCLLAWIPLLLALSPAALGTGEKPEVLRDATYTALRGARPAGEGVSVEGVVLVRDAFRITLSSGTVHFLEPVGGRTVGAVFAGRGSTSLLPASEIERRHLEVVTGEKGLTTLDDTFERAVFLFTDGTADELRASPGAVAAAVAGPEDASLWDRIRKHQRRELRSNLQIRLLADLLEGTQPKDGVFVAWLEGKKHGEGLLAFDPRGVEKLGLAEQTAGETTVFFSLKEATRGPVYLSSRKAGADAARALPAGPDADALHYVLDTRIRKSTDLEGTALVRFRSLRDGLRVLRLDLFPKLRVTQASLSAGTPGAERVPLAVVQEDEKEDGDLAVVLPRPLAKDEVATLGLTYAGEDVLVDAGDGNYAVLVRQSWYPNLGTFVDTATFDLTYRVPKKNQVVSVGREVESSVSADGTAVARFVAEAPLRVAGFNYGKFRKLERTDEESGLVVRVYTNPGRPSIATELEQVAAFARFDTERMADSALVDGVNTARTGWHFFGPLPQKDVAITQQSQWFFGQSWPSLIYLPYVAFLDSTTRADLGLVDVSSFVDEVGPHEFAHQWWGHLVGWASYRDQWLSEGFAEFTTALVIQQTGGRGKYLDFWKKARRRVLSTTRGGSRRAYDVGPVSLGYRLEQGRADGAYATVVYSKGAWVLQMLRMMLWDARSKDPDHRFVTAMKEFVSTWAGKNPTTADFRRVVEKQMTPEMDLGRDGTLGWFFRQWVDGTDMPRYAHTLSVADIGGGKYRISGEITQSDVPNDFLGYVPLYVEFDGGNVARLGAVTLTGSSSLPVNAEIALPRAPKRIVPNAMQDVLTRD